MTTMAAADAPVQSPSSWRDRMRQAPVTSPSYQQRTSQYSSRDGVDGGYIPEYRADALYVDEYDDSPNRSSGTRHTETAWRQDSPMQQHTREQPLQGWQQSSHLRPQQSTISIQSSTGSFSVEEQKAHAWEVAHNYPYMPPKEQVVQSRPSVPQQLSWASSGNAPSPRRPMNFSRPRRIAEETNPVNIREETLVVPDVDEDENSYRDRRLEERLRRLDVKNTTRARPEEKARPISQPQSQPPPSQPQQQQLSQPPSRPAQIPHSAKSAYSRPTLSPIPSAASAVTLSQLGRLREVPEEDDSAEDDYNIPDGLTPTPVTYNGFMANAVQPNASASSSATSFASQVSPVPLSHYPAGAIPLFDQEHNLVDKSFQQAITPKQTASRPRIATNRSHEAPIPTHIPTDSTSTTRTTDTTTRSSNGDPHSNHTSATSSSQPSIDVDRITSLPSAPTSSNRPVSNHSQSARTPFMLTRPLLSHQNSTASASTTAGGPPNSPSSLGIVRPMRTNSTTSSGATSAMEAFKASNYDVSSLTASQVAKLKKKGIDPALYMEMKAATGGIGKDGKKRSKWTRALVGNTFIG